MINQPECLVTAAVIVVQSQLVVLPLMPEKCSVCSRGLLFCPPCICFSLASPLFLSFSVSSA